MRDKTAWLLELARAGDWHGVWEELKNTLWLAVWWRYRCVQAWEVHYPDEVVEIDPGDNEELLDVIRLGLQPGNRPKIYIRYAGGKRLRVRLTRF